MELRFLDQFLQMIFLGDLRTGNAGLIASMSVILEVSTSNRFRIFDWEKLKVLRKIISQSLKIKGIAMSSSEVILYTSHDGSICLKLKTLENTVWLTQAEIAELFGKGRSTIAEHISAIFDDGELESDRVCRKFRQTADDGKLYDVIHYNLDLVLAVGYRTRSPRGVQFRKWATTTLREYLVKGFVMDDARLKEPQPWDYFDEWLERIREIRASEKRFYQKVRDIYATAIDYDSKSDQALLFFKKVQNKMLWATTHQTAAELIVGRADPALPNMGLKSINDDI